MKLKLSKSRFRVLLTEVLPYERPLFFSNKFYAHLLKRYKVEEEDGRLVSRCEKKEEGLDSFLRLISAYGNTDSIKNYNYLISKDGYQDGRRLTVIHPFHQVCVVDFYNIFSDLIIHFCEKSHFSIRHPYKVASVLKIENDYSKVISDDAESEITPDSAKSFFVYKKYSNISKFYDDYSLMDTEREFEHLLKVDIEKCFDTINPDLLYPLVYDFEAKSKLKEWPNDFISDFIYLHKAIRKGLPVQGHSKNGIVIGPEFSRIFAEIFMQHIERLIENKLEQSYGLKFREDYKIFRYVDDSFIAADTIEHIKIIKTVYSGILAEYGLKLKESKMRFYAERPFLDDISLIKARLKKFVEETFENRLDTFAGFIKLQEGDFKETPTFHNAKNFMQTMRLIAAEIKLAERNGKVGSSIEMDEKPESVYRDISSYTLAITHKRLLKLLREFNDLYRNYSEGIFKDFISEKGRIIKDLYETNFQKFCESLIRSLFFLFSSDMRMATSISLVRTVDSVQRFVRGEYIFPGNVKSQKFPSHVVSAIDEVITDETLKILRHKNFHYESGLMEVLNVLELQHIMFPRSRVGEKPLLNFLKRNDAEKRLHFFTTFQLIHFAEGKNRYSGVIDFVRPWIENQCKTFSKTRGTNTESLLTVLELFSIPEKYGLDRELSIAVTDKEELQQLNKFFRNAKGFFMRWEGYKVSEEIDLRKGQNVY